jgi:hypothetical protein
MAPPEDAVKDDPFERQLILEELQTFPQPLDDFGAYFVQAAILLSRTSAKFLAIVNGYR